MTLNIPTGSIMWAKIPNTETYMPYRMRTLIQLWKYENGQKTQLITARYSNDGGVHGANNHPAGSSLDLPLGRYCYVVYNMSPNQVPAQMVIFRGDSTNTNTVWGTAPDIAGNACYAKVESGEVKEIIFDVEQYQPTGGYYHLNCNAWFVSSFELNFGSSPVDTAVTDYALNPLRIGRPRATNENGDFYKENIIGFVNYMSGSYFEIPNTQYFQGTETLNPFYEPDNNINTQNPIYSASGNTPTPTPPPPTQNAKTNKIIIGSLAFFVLLAIRKNGNNN